MCGYIIFPIPRDPTVVVEDSYEVMRTGFPGWEPDDADEMTLALRAAAVGYADVGTLVTRMAEEAFRYAGRSMFGLPPQDATQAAGQVTLTAIDTNGPYLVPDGTYVSGRNPNGILQAFQTVGDVTIPNGSTTVVANVLAVDSGTDGNDVTGTGYPEQYLDYITGYEFVGTTSGAMDRQEDAPYLDDLRELLQLQSPRPLRADDAGVLARRFLGDGARATVIDMLNADTNNTDDPGHETVAVVDSQGAAIASLLKTQLAAYLTGLRAMNYVFHVIDPTFHQVDVSTAVVVIEGWDHDAVVAAVTAQIASFLSPATWGSTLGVGEGFQWRNRTIIRHNELEAAILRVDGVDYIGSFGTKLAFHGNTLGTTDLTMSGYAPLPTNGTFVVTAA